MVRRFVAAAMIVAFALMAAPVPVVAQEGAGSISGTATGESGNVLSNMTVQVRDAVTKQLVGTGTTNAQGVFSITGLNPGQFVVEIVNAQGAIVGTTATVTLTTGAMVATGVAITATAAGAIAGGAAAAGGLGAFFGSTLGIVTGVVVAGTVTTATLIATKKEASPSR